jgi:hypothetical protein
MSTHHDREPAGPAREDPALVRAWRQASDEQPPTRLDAAILDAARRSVAMDDEGATTRRDQPRTRNRWMQWQPLAAAATVAGLAFVLLQTLPREREVAPPIRIQAPAPASSPERDIAPPTESEAPAAPPAPTVTRESRSGSPPSVVAEPPTELESTQLSRERSDAGASGASAAEASPDVGDTMRQAESEPRKGVMTDASSNSVSRESVAPAARRTETFGLSTAAPPSAADWATLIEGLHATGDLAAAAAALREFRTADPDADSYLPESLRDWARTVR